MMEILLLFTAFKKILRELVPAPPESLHTRQDGVKNGDKGYSFTAQGGKQT